MVVFTTAARIIELLPEDSPEYRRMVEAFDAAPAAGYPEDLARALVEVWRDVDPGYAAFFRNWQRRKADNAGAGRKLATA